MSLSVRAAGAGARACVERELWTHRSSRAAELEHKRSTYGGTAAVCPMLLVDHAVLLSLIISKLKRALVVLFSGSVFHVSLVATSKCEAPRRRRRAPRSRLSTLSSEINVIAHRRHRHIPSRIADKRYSLGFGLIRDRIYIQ